MVNCIEIHAKCLGGRPVSYHSSLVSYKMPRAACLVLSPQRHGAGFDPPINVCACSLQNAPGGSEDNTPGRLSHKIKLLCPERVF